MSPCPFCDFAPKNYCRLSGYELEESDCRGVVLCPRCGCFVATEAIDCMAVNRDALTEYAVVLWEQLVERRNSEKSAANHSR